MMKENKILNDDELEKVTGGVGETVDPSKVEEAKKRLIDLISDDDKKADVPKKNKLIRY